jgi:uncharacterized protein YbjQ (UPF0145 family)
MSLQLYTTHNYDENVYKPLGFVRGTMVHAVSFFRDIISNVAGMFGGVNPAINKKIDDTYDEAIQELIKYTKSKYPSATAITGINVSLTEMREFIICVAFGTALGPASSSSSSSSSASSTNPVNKGVPVGGFRKYKYSKNINKKSNKNRLNSKKKYTKRHK